MLEFPVTMPERSTSSLTHGSRHVARPSLPARTRAAAMACASLLLLLAVAAASPPAPGGSPAPPKQPRLEDFIAPPGSTQKFQPFMLHADLWLGIDQRAKLDSIVFVLVNGARTCQVMNRDSTWVVDYTWVYPHNLLPPRWYDARSLIHTGDSLKLADDADVQFTFGTLRLAVRATDLKSAEAEAYRRWPREMPSELRGRLKLKVERARKALAGEKDTEPKHAPPPAKPAKSGGSPG